MYLEIIIAQKDHENIRYGYIILTSYINYVQTIVLFRLHSKVGRNMNRQSI